MLPVFVVAYVVAVNALAALVLNASIGRQDTRLTADQRWAQLAARSYCDNRQRGVSESASRHRAFHAYSARQPQPGPDSASATLFESAIAETCPRFRVGSGDGAI